MSRGPWSLCLVTQHFAPDFEGGAERVVRSQARELARLGHRVRIVSGTDRTDRDADHWTGEVDGLEVTYVPRRAGEHYDLVLERPRLSERVAQLCRGADLVHVHHWSTLSSDLVRTLSRAAPVIVSLHDFFAVCPRFFRRSPISGLACPAQGELEPCARCVEADAGGVSRADLLGRLERRSAGFQAEIDAAARAVSPSRFHGAEMSRLLGLPATKLAVIPPGLCTPHSSGRHRAGERRPWQGDRPLVVVHFGHLSRAKGTLDLVQSLAELPPGSIELVLAGTFLEPGLEEDIRRAAGALRWTLYGVYRGVEGLESLALRADLAAFPSRLSESYGLVVDEALSLGLPAWVSDRGALGERLGGAGRVLPAEHPRAWTDALRGLLRDPKSFAEERLALPETQRTAADAAREFEDLYASAVAERRAS